MRRELVVGAAIAAAIVAVYAQVAGHEFLEFDDGLYVTGNARVQQGLHWENLVWAVTNLDAHIWHPLTWLHYLVDFELYGVASAGPWLLTNVAWHIAATLVLLHALASLTGRFWPSAFAAALFALHPIQSEPVAWVSGRKEVLAGFFTFLTLAAYARYVRRRNALRYLAVLGSALLTLAAKGSQVALPFLLLLLDYWPLRRLRLGGAGGERLADLVVEKLPLLFLSLTVVLIQLAPVSGVYGPWAEDPPLFERLQDGILAYVATLGRLFWPDALAIVHPTSVQMGLGHVGALPVLAALGLLGAVTALAVAAGQRYGQLLVGWLWFLGMLLPMIGLVPAGLRVMHDRYAYVPMVGLAVAFGFGGAELLSRWRAPRAVGAAAAAVPLALCAVLCWVQVGVWRDSQTLFDHALAVTGPNAIVHFYRGNSFAAAGDMAAARREFEAALDVVPTYPDANEALGRVHLREGRPDLARACFERAVEARPGWTDALANLGRAQWTLGARSEALETFEAAARSAPDSAEVRYLLATSLHASGRLAEAAESFREVLRLDPGHAGAARGLARIQRGAPGVADPANPAPGAGDEAARAGTAAPPRAGPRAGGGSSR